MMIFLQLWGATLFLLNKIFFSLAERSGREQSCKKWRIQAWIVYLIGLPPWVIILISEKNWIAASVEASGAPAMLTGLMIAIKGHGNAPKWLDHLAVLGVAGGLGLSLVDNEGLTSITQILELGVAAGFLLGTYYSAKQSFSGYYWLMFGSITCGTLMGLQGYPLLMIQQFVSLVLIMDAQRAKKLRLKNLKIHG